MQYMVVMPSIREFPLEFLEPVLAADVPVVVVDDSNGVAKRHKHKLVTYFSHDDQADYLPSAPYIIPRRNPSCKNFGMYFAYKEGADIIILLDDDCDTRHAHDFMGEIPVGKPVSARRFTTPSGWLNTMALLTDSYDLYARGYPYEYRGESMELLDTVSVTPLFNEGLWSGLPDINGMDKLIAGDDVEVKKKRALVKGDYVLLGFSQRLPLSIMNVQLHRKLVPAFYQPPDWECGDGYRVRRHDDVWSMYFLKLLMDKHYHTATVGAPLVKHDRTGDMYKEMISENMTNLAQRYVTDAMTRAVNMTDDNLDYATHATLAGAELLNIATRDIERHGRFAEILVDYARRIIVWAGLFIE